MQKIIKPNEANIANADCNYDNPTLNETIETNISSIESLKVDVVRYDDYIKANAPLVEQNIIMYSNFKKTDLQQLINENEDCNFIRIYHAINSANKHYTIAVPVMETGNGKVKQTNGVKYYVNCCACRPNCPTNFGF
jgi:hypothetical protein